MHHEKYTTWVKLKETQINGKISSMHGLEQLALLRCPHLPKAIYNFDVISVKIERFLYTNRKTNPKIHLGTIENPEWPQ